MDDLSKWTNFEIISRIRVIDRDIKRLTDEQTALLAEKEMRDRGEITDG